MRPTRAGSFLLVMMVCLACSESVEIDPGAWPQWRGRDGHGRSDTHSLPSTWSDDASNVRWRALIPGKGNSSPIVSQGRVFLTSARVRAGRVNHLVIALDLETGKILWSQSAGRGTRAKRHYQNTYAGPTPVTDGATVFAYFGEALIALTLEGEVLWRATVKEDYDARSHYGAGSSLVLADEAVVVAHDRETLEEDKGWLAAYDKTSGEELWRTEWDDSCCSYVTPLVRRRGKATEIIFTHAAYVAGYDALDGRRLWSHPIDLAQPVASPLAEDDLLVVFSGAHGVRMGEVLRLSGEGERTGVEVLWATKRMIPGTSSPVIYDGALYTLTAAGILIRYDLLTGDVVWRERLERGTYQASLVAGDGKVYAVNSDGVTSVVAAAPSFELISGNRIGRGGNASPAIVEGSLLLRTSKELIRIDREDSAAGG